MFEINRLKNLANENIQPCQKKEDISSSQKGGEDSVANNYQLKEEIKRKQTQKEEQKATEKIFQYKDVNKDLYINKNLNHEEFSKYIKTVQEYISTEDINFLFEVYEKEESQINNYCYEIADILNCKNSEDVEKIISTMKEKYETKGNTQKKSNPLTVELPAEANNYLNKEISLSSFEYSDSYEYWQKYIETTGLDEAGEIQVDENTGETYITIDLQAVKNNTVTLPDGIEIILNSNNDKYDPILMYNCDTNEITIENANIESFVASKPTKLNLNNVNINEIDLGKNEDLSHLGNSGNFGVNIKNSNIGKIISNGYNNYFNIEKSVLEEIRILNEKAYNNTLITKNSEITKDVYSVGERFSATFDDTYLTNCNFNFNNHPENVSFKYTNSSISNHQLNEIKDAGVEVVDLDTVNTENYTSITNENKYQSIYNKGFDYLLSSQSEIITIKEDGHTISFEYTYDEQGNKTGIKLSSSEGSKFFKLETTEENNTQMTTISSIEENNSSILLYSVMNYTNEEGKKAEEKLYFDTIGKTPNKTQTIYNKNGIPEKIIEEEQGKITTYYYGDNGEIIYGEIKDTNKNTLSTLYNFNYSSTGILISYSEEEKGYSDSNFETISYSCEYEKNKNGEILYDSISYMSPQMCEVIKTFTIDNQALINEKHNLTHLYNTVWDLDNLEKELNYAIQTNNYNLLAQYYTQITYNSYQNVDTDINLDTDEETKVARPDISLTTSLKDISESLTFTEEYLKEMNIMDLAEDVCAPIQAQADAMIQYLNFTNDNMPLFSKFCSNLGCIIPWGTSKEDAIKIVQEWADKQIQELEKAFEENNAPKIIGLYKATTGREFTEKNLMSLQTNSMFVEEVFNMNDEQLKDFAISISIYPDEYKDINELKQQIYSIVLSATSAEIGNSTAAGNVVNEYKTQVATIREVLESIIEIAGSAITGYGISSLCNKKNVSKIIGKVLKTTINAGIKMIPDMIDASGIENGFREGKFTQKLASAFVSSVLKEFSEPVLYGLEKKLLGLKDAYGFLKLDDINNFISNFLWMYSSEIGEEIIENNGKISIDMFKDNLLDNMIRASILSSAEKLIYELAENLPEVEDEISDNIEKNVLLEDLNNDEVINNIINGEELDFDRGLFLLANIHNLTPSNYFDEETLNILENTILERMTISLKEEILTEIDYNDIQSLINEISDIFNIETNADVALQEFLRFQESVII